MAETTSYTSLLNMAPRYVDNNAAEFIAILPTLINRAQDRIQRELELDMWRTMVASQSLSAATFTRPSSWLKIYSVYVPASSTFIERRSIDYVRWLATSAAPRAYAEYTETQLLFGPTPDTTYTIDFETLQKPTALSTSNETDWMTENVPELLLFGTLSSAETFLIGHERKQEFEAEYQRELASKLYQLRGITKKEETPVRYGPVPALDKGMG